MKITILTLVTLLITLGTAFSQALTDGLWLNASGEGKILFFKEGETISGKLVWLKFPNDDAGKPKVDKNNPDEKLKTRPTLGLQVIKGLKPSDKNEWDGGSVYDPKSGKTYSLKITLEDPKTLKVRGYLGFSLIGRTETWTRAQ